jgi:hypothetical protein
MLRTLIALVALLSLTASASAQTAPTPLDSLFAQHPTGNGFLQSLSVTDSPLSAPHARSCCKLCTVGKAFGNTCIPITRPEYAETRVWKDSGTRCAS